MSIGLRCVWSMHQIFDHLQFSCAHRIARSHLKMHTHTHTPLIIWGPIEWVHSCDFQSPMMEGSVPGVPKTPQETTPGQEVEVRRTPKDAPITPNKKPAALKRRSGSFGPKFLHAHVAIHLKSTKLQYLLEHPNAFEQTWPKICIWFLMKQSKSIQRRNSFWFS